MKQRLRDINHEPRRSRTTWLRLYLTESPSLAQPRTAAEFGPDPLNLDGLFLLLREIRLYLTYLLSSCPEIAFLAISSVLLLRKTHILLRKMNGRPCPSR